LTRTISVKEAAAALNLTPRAVSYRLEKGQLKGTLAKNEATGVPEWRIFPNKEILAGLTKPAVDDSTAMDFEPSDIVDAESVTDAAEDAVAPQSESRTINADFQMIVEQCVRPLVEEVKAQALALAERDRIIEEQGRQLRLLPDLQRRAEEEGTRAEEVRKASELKELEAIALKKQAEAVAAIEAKKSKEKEQQLSAVLEQERLKAETLEAQVVELSESKTSLEATLQEEIARLKEEKEAQTKAVQDQLQSLTEKLEKMEKPWWKKLFSSSET
jgi:hypothetical protein